MQSVEPACDLLHPPGCSPTQELCLSRSEITPGAAGVSLLLRLGCWAPPGLQLPQCCCIPALQEQRAKLPGLAVPGRSRGCPAAQSPLLPHFRVHLSSSCQAGHAERRILLWGFLPKSPVLPLPAKGWLARKEMSCWECRVWHFHKWHLVSLHSENVSLSLSCPFLPFSEKIWCSLKPVKFKLQLMCVNQAACSSCVMLITTTFKTAQTLNSGAGTCWTKYSFNFQGFKFLPGF